MLSALACIFALAPSTVILERSVDGYWAAEDTTLDSQGGSALRGGDSILDGGSGKTILIQFQELDRLLRGKKITGATLHLTLTGGEPKLLAARRVLKGWQEGPIRVVAQEDPAARWGASWTSRRTGPNPIDWELPGARGSQDAEKIADAKADRPKPDQVDISGLGAAFEFMRQRPWAANGIALEFSDKVQFLSMEATEGRPKLELTVEQEDARPEAADLCVESIARTPMYPKIQVGVKQLPDGNQIADDPSNPDAKMWPADADPVTYTVTIKNNGKVASVPCDAAWGIREKSTRLVSIKDPIEPGKSVQLTTELPFKTDLFDHRRQPISFRVFPKSADANPANDFLEIQENALAFGIEFDSEMPEMVLGQSKQEWAQSAFRTWNEVYARQSKYSFAPDGAKERVYIHKFAAEGGISAEEAMNLDGIIHVKGIVFKADTPADPRATLDVLKQISISLGLIDLNLSQFPEAADPFPGLLGGDTRLESGLPGLYAMPMDSVSDPVLDRVNMVARGMLSAVDVGALNGRVGRRRGYSGEYLYDVPETIAISVADINGNKLPNTEFKFTPLSKGQLDTAKSFTMKSSETAGIILQKKDVVETKPAMTGSHLHSNPFGNIDVTNANGAMKVETKVNGVTASTWLKLSGLVESTYRGQKQLGFVALRFNVPKAQLVGENLVPPNSSDPMTDGVMDTSKTVTGDAFEIDLGREVGVGEIRLKALSLWDRFDIEAYDSNKDLTKLPRVFAKEFSGSWALKARQEGGWVVYRGLESRVRFLRFVKRGPGTMNITEIAAKGVQL